jgi:hypothetical protein
MAAHRRVINHLKLKWMIAADDVNPFTREIMEIFRFETPTADRFDSALSDMENIVDSDEWHREAEFSADSRGRHQADAVARTPARADDAMLGLWVRLHEKGGKHHELPCHHNLEVYLHEYLDRTGIAGDPTLE